MGLEMRDAADGQAVERCRAKNGLLNLLPSIFRPHSSLLRRTNTTAGAYQREGGNKVPVILHLVSTNFQAQAEGFDIDDLIRKLVAEVPEPNIPKYEKQ